jgi:hypothetical protein
MKTDACSIREAAARIDWVAASGARYWPGAGASHVTRLAMPEMSGPASKTCILIQLPDWAADIGVGHPASLLVDGASVAAGAGAAFERCNWIHAAYLFLSGAQEAGQPAASYSGSAADPRLFDHAWVNRIFLLLRRMAARQAGLSEDALFGALPQAQFHITHDVDAVRKTMEIRFKQTAFHAFNVVRSGMHADWPRARQKLVQAMRFLFTTPSYWNFETVRRMEDRHGLRSTFNFYGGPGGWRRGSPRKILLDPGYDVGQPALRREIECLRQGGWRIGLHPSFDAWKDPALIRKQRETVEAAAGAPVLECRQHWLRFDWQQSWAAQEKAGLTLDTTLGFNDRPAFRNGAALRFRPWNAAVSAPRRIEVLPMLLMDSHFYDYSAQTDEERRAALARWTGEVRAVGGEASVNWHVHTLAQDYGWQTGYKELLEAVAG